MADAGNRLAAATVMMVLLLAACSSGSGKATGPSSASPTDAPHNATSGSVAEALRDESTVRVAVRTERRYVRSLVGRFAGTDPAAFLAKHATLFGVGEGGFELGSSTKSRDALGALTRFGIVHDDVLVDGAELSVRSDNKGTITFVLATGPNRVDISQDATVSEPQAVAAARGTGETGTPTGQFRIADLDGDGTASDQVWEFTYTGSDRPDRVVLVDAVTGALRAAFDDEHESVCPTKKGVKSKAALPASSPSDDPVVVEGRRLAGQVVRYYGDHLLRGGYDGKSSTFAIVHGPRSAWSGEGKMSLATGEATLDVIAHEFTHGVMGADARLGRTAAGAAINESYADVFASFIDGNWLIGEKTPKGVRRDLSKRRTSADYQALPAAVPPGPGNDSGCAHANSTILSHAAWLAVNGCPAGGDSAYCRTLKSTISVRQAEQVYYESIRRIGPGHDFAAVRDEIVHACDRMLVGRQFGIQPEDCAALINAFHAIGYGPADSDSDGIVDDADNCFDVFNPDQAPSTDDKDIGAACISSPGGSEPPPPPPTASTTPPTTAPTASSVAPAAGDLQVLRLETKTNEATEGVCSRAPDENIPTVIHHSYAYYIGDAATLQRIACQEQKPVQTRWSIYACRASLLMTSRATVIATRLSYDDARAFVAREAKLPQVSSGYVAVAGPDDGKQGTVKAGVVNGG